MTEDLRQIVESYTKLRVGDKLVDLPYTIATSQINTTGAIMGRTSRYANFAGKGRPDQIHRALLSEAGRHNLNLAIATPQEIHAFMIKQGIGVDCSGFVYNVLDAYLRANKLPPLNQLILRRNDVLGRLERLLLGWRWVRRCSAATLTNDFNTAKVLRADAIRPGDVIRLTHADWPGNHIAIVVATSKSQITYAHSSGTTQHQGPHTAFIKITHPELGLENQSWEELTQSGHNYGTYSFQPVRGDSVRRLMILAKNSIK